MYRLELGEIVGGRTDLRKDVCPQILCKTDSKNLQSKVFTQRKTEIFQESSNKSFTQRKLKLYKEKLKSDEGQLLTRGESNTKE